MCTRWKTQSNIQEREVKAMTMLIYHNMMMQFGNSIKDSFAHTHTSTLKTGIDIL